MGLTDETGSVAQAYLYDEFGNLLQTWGNIPNHYLYTGQEWDSEIAGTELYNLRARYYDTGIGRFISEDPSLQVGCEGGWGCRACVTTTSYHSLSFLDTFTPQVLNAYPYVSNNPINLSDPSGEAIPGFLLHPCLYCGACAGGAILGCYVGCANVPNYWECVADCINDYLRCFLRGPLQPWPDPVCWGACGLCFVRYVSRRPGVKRPPEISPEDFLRMLRRG